MMPGLTQEQKAKGRLELKFAHGAGAFAFADIGSKLITGTLRYLSSGDPRDIVDGVGVGTARTLGEMMAGTAAADAALRAARGAINRELFVKTVDGWKLNSAAFTRGSTGLVGRIASPVGAVAAMQLIESGEVDPKALANSLAVMKGAQLIARLVGSVGPLKNLKAGHPAMMLVEFLVMHGLSEAEAWAVLHYEIRERRFRMADAMMKYDAALDGVRMVADKGRRMDGSAEIKHLESARGALEAAHREYSEILRYAGATEYRRAGKVYSDLEDAKEELHHIEAQPARPDVLDGLLIGFLDASPSPVGAKFVPKFTREEIEAQKAAWRGKVAEKEGALNAEVEGGNAQFVERMREHGREVLPVTMHIAFPAEERSFVSKYAAARVSKQMVRGAGYLHARGDGIGDQLPSAADEGKATFGMRYRDRVSGDPYDFALQYLLFVRERDVYLASALSREP